MRAAEIPRASCSRRIIAMERARLRFRTSATRHAVADEGLEIVAGQSLLRRAKLDGVDAVGGVLSGNSPIRVHRLESQAGQAGFPGFIGYLLRKRHYR
jgi:hypothetical protein